MDKSKELTILKSKNSREIKSQPRFLRLWLLLLLALLLVASYFYYQHKLSQESFANSNYFRVLSETTQKINENIEQFIRLHQFCESETTIRSIFLSYTSKNKSPDCKIEEASFLKYAVGIEGEKVIISKDKNFNKEKGLKDGNNIVSDWDDIGEIDIVDILPAIKSGFSGYLIASENKEVIASTERLTGLSIVNVNLISRLITEKNNQNWKNLSNLDNDAEQNPSPQLPGHSQLLDVELTSVDYRLFIYPFKLKEMIIKDKQASYTELHIIGVLPKSVLQRFENQRWNLSLLSIVLILLLFVWMMARLFMLSNDQSVTELFYKSIMVSSYILFVMVFSLLISFGEKIIKQNHKQDKAYQMIERINLEFKEELYSIFKELNNFHNYYQSIIPQFEKIADHSASSEDVDEAKIEDFCIAADGASVKHFVELLPTGYKQGKAIVGMKESKSFLYDPATDVIDKELDTQFCLNQISILSDNVRHVDNTKYIEKFVSKQSDLISNKLLTVHALDANVGIDVLPSFSSIEVNKPRANYDLSHRKYFREVRDNRGWSVKFCNAENKTKQCDLNNSVAVDEFNNFYIQRLRNINNGVRGTTIAMPLNNKSHWIRYMMVADIDLTSLTATEFLSENELMDLTLMVVGRDTGEVLFHLDENRNLVENLYHSGEGTEDISHRIRSGLGGNKKK